MKKSDNKGLRSEILRATRELLVKEGFPSLSMRKIATEIGCKAPSIYYYFENKAALVQALIDEGHQHLYEHMAEAVAPYENPLDRIEAYMRAFISFGLENAEYYEIMFLLPIEGETCDPKTSFRVARRSQDLSITAFEECVGRGWIKPDNFVLATGSIGISLHGYLALALNHQKDPPFDKQRMLDYIIDKIFLSHGIGGTPYEREPLKA